MCVCVCVCVQAEGCAAKTAQSLRVGQQLLQVDDTSLHGLKHRDTVMAIKSAFEGPMNKTITFVVLDHKEVYIIYVSVLPELLYCPHLYIVSVLPSLSLESVH